MNRQLLWKVSIEQAVIKLTDKKKRNKRYIENCRPILLLNFNTSILSKAISSKEQVYWFISNLNMTLHCKFKYNT